MRDENICKESPDGNHEPDLSTVVHHDQDVFDVNCKHCGTSGSFVLILPPNDINW